MELKKTEVEEKVEEEHHHHFHVLAVDDSLIDRKLLEKLLTISSCQGTIFILYIYPLIYLFHLIIL